MSISEKKPQAGQAGRAVHQVLCLFHAGHPAAVPAAHLSAGAVLRPHRLVQHPLPAHPPEPWPGGHLCVQLPGHWGRHRRHGLLCRLCHHPVPGAVRQLPPCSATSPSSPRATSGIRSCGTSSPLCSSPSCAASSWACMCPCASSSSPPAVYNVLITVINGGVQMVIYFPIYKIIFPEGEAK